MHADVTIIGAGVIGCSIARELSSRLPKCAVVVVEKEPAPGAHQSSRNSGVIHSGFNPSPGSLKARLCVEGNLLMKQFCRSQNVRFDEVGTLVAASSEKEESMLHALEERGRANCVPGLEILSLDQARQLEPNLADGLTAVMSSPTGAIVDASAFVSALVREGTERGVTFLFERRVINVSPASGQFELHLSDGTLLSTERVINAAGVWVDQIARMFGWDDEYVMVPFRGRYWRIAGGDELIRSMVYPVPDPRFPFLGVHATKRVDGSVVLGPNAMLAFGREAYSFWHVDFRDLAEMARAGPFWRFLRRPEIVKLAMTEIERSLSSEKIAVEASKILRGVRDARLIEGPAPGIRAQLVDREGNLVDDFLLQVGDGIAHVLNAVSPGLTCSLAFARHLLDELGRSSFFGGGLSQSKEP